MRNAPSLRLRKEHLAELTPAQLRAVAGGTEHTDGGLTCIVDLVTDRIRTVIEIDTGSHHTTEGC